MNEIKILINFKEEKNIIYGTKPITGDYNSTKMLFTFEDNPVGMKVLKIRPKESNNPVYVGEINNNEVILTRVDEDNKNHSIFSEAGVYILEVTLYNEDSKLTSVYSEFLVNKEQIEIDGEIVETYLPIFDELINTVNEKIEDMESVKQDVIDANEEAKKTIADFEDDVDTYTNAFNQNAQEKTNAVNQIYQDTEALVNGFDDKVDQAKTDLNTIADNAQTIYDNFDTNASIKLQEYNTNATSKLNAYNDNATSKTTSFNSNAESKTTAFNTNANDKTTAFNTNADEKTIEYNENASAKVEEFNQTVDSIQESINNHEERISDLERNQKTGEATGTEIELNDAFDTRPRYLGIDATKTKQGTTTGANYFNANIINNIKNIIVEDKGKTIKMPINTSGQGYTYINKKLIDLCPNINIGDQVYLYFTRNLGTSTNNYIYLEGVSQTWQNGASKTITEQMLNSVVSLYGNNPSVGETAQCILTDFRIVKNTTDEWEEFTDNQASPNPEYPQDVETMKSQNLLSNPFVQYNANTLKTEIPDFKTGTYTFSFSGDLFATWQVTARKIVNGTRTQIEAKFNVKSISFTLDEEATLELEVYRSGILLDDIYETMLNKGTEKIPYVPYDSILVDDVGKNLFDKDNANMLNAYMSQGKIISEANNRMIYMKLKPNTAYTLSFSQRNANNEIITNDDAHYAFTANIPEIGSSVINRESISKNSNNKYIKTFTTDSTNLYFCLKVANVLKSNLLNTLATLQIEQGSATPYETYQHKQYPISLGNQELLNKGDYADKIIVDESTGQSYIEKVWGKYIITGNEEWGLQGQNRSRLAITPAIKNPANADTLPVLFCTHYIAKTVNQTYLLNQGISVATSESVIIIYDSNYSPVDLALYKNWLQNQYNNGTPVILYYLLAEPQLIPIDNPNIKLLNGVNHITNSEGAEMDIVYVKDINLYLENELSNIKNAIVSLGGDI